MSLTQHIDSDPGLRALAGSLVTFAQGIGCKLVAEGVETEREWQVLTQLGVDTAQGFYMHRPKSAPDLARLLAGQE